jgi:hypothetical protein
MNVEDVRRIEEEHRLWRAGSIRHLLDDHQLLIYDPYRAWEARRLAELDTIPEEQWGIHQVFQVDCARQTGKTYATSAIRAEDALNEQNEEEYLVGAATEVALKELVIPTMRRVFESAPEDVRPEFVSSRWGMRAGYYFPTTGARIKLVGWENPDDHRGPGLGGANISEAAFVPKLRYAVNSVLIPQFSRRPRATLILESSAPEDGNHPFDALFKPDAQRRKAYVFMSLWDNVSLSDKQKRAMLASARAINEDDANREYLGIRGRDKGKMIVPTFDKKRHVKESPRPEHALAIMAQDDGIIDLYFAGWGYWDAQRAKLVVEREFYGRNTTTSVVADEIRDAERGLYLAAAGIHKPRFILGTPKEERERVLRVLSGEEPGHVSEGFGIVKPDGLCWWDGEEFQPNPALRVSDTSARLIADLNHEHGIPICATEKDDAEAASYALRDAFKLDKIEINPRCVGLIRHLESGHWNKNRTDWARYVDGPEAELFGHFDGVAMLIYMWRMVQSFRSVDPFPPKFVDRHNPDVMFIPEPWREQQTSALEEFFA